MKKFIATTICMLLVYLLIFKAIPSVYPGIGTLSDYKSINITPTKEIDYYPTKVNKLMNIIKNNNAIGVSYIPSINDMNEINQKNEQNSSDNQEVVEQPILQDENQNTNNDELSNSDTNLVLTMSELTEITLESVKLITISEKVNNDIRMPYFEFEYNGQKYIGGLGVMGSTSAIVNSIDILGQIVLIQQGNKEYTFKIGSELSIKEVK